MRIVVLARMVPDLIEELEIDASGVALDTTWLRMIINEFDEHAIEQAILLKESGQAEVIVVAPEAEDVDQVLYTAAARGADRLIKLTGDFEEGLNNHALARAAAGVIGELAPDLVLTGVQAHNDLDGALGPLVAAQLEWPYVGYVAGMALVDGLAEVRKEYPGGLVAEMEVTLPAVVGVQVAEQPPRYVAISKVRQAMHTATIEEREVADLDPSGGVPLSRMYLPEAAGRAQMLEGDEQEIAAGLVQVLRQLGVL